MTKFRIKQTVFEGSEMFLVQRRFLFVFWLTEAAGYNEDRARLKLAELVKAEAGSGRIVHTE